MSYKTAIEGSVGTILLCASQITVNTVQKNVSYFIINNHLCNNIVFYSYTLNILTNLWYI